MPASNELQEVEDLLGNQSTDTSETKAIEELLGGPENTTDEPDGLETADDDESPPEEDSGVDNAEGDDALDYTLKVPMTDGTKVTLSELKDYYQGQASNLVALQERENAYAQKVNELQEVMPYVNIPNHIRAKIANQQQVYLNNQHDLMMQVLPEWKDPAVLNTAKDEIYALGRDYGVEDQIANVTDHRLIKMLNDYAKLRKSVKAAKDNVKPLRSETPVAAPRQPKSKGTDLENSIKVAKASGRTSDQLAAINKLLG